MASTSRAGSVGARRAAVACVVLIGATLATLSPAAAQQPTGATPPGYCGPVTGLAITWLVEAIDNQTFNQQVTDGQAAFDAAYASFSPDDPEPGLLQEGLSAYPSVIAPLTDAVAAAGGNYLDVPQAARTQYYQDIAKFMNRVLEFIEPYCSPPTPVAALIGPCTNGPLSLPPLLGINTLGQPVTATVDGKEYTVGAAPAPGRPTTELVFIEVPADAAPGDVLLNGVPALVTPISCSSVFDGVASTGYADLVTATFTQGCAATEVPAALVLGPKATLQNAVGLDDVLGGVGAPFDLHIEVNGYPRVLRLPSGDQVPFGADAGVPLVTVSGETVDVVVQAASCPDAPSSDDDSVSAAPLSPRFTG